MIPEMRQEFNRRWRPELYRKFLAEIDRRGGTHVKFRNSETPCFFERALLDRMARYGREMVAQLLGDPEYLARAGAAIPAEFRVANEDPHPLFIQADFGLDERLDPKLVEIQGFPSLYAFQPMVADAYREIFSLTGVEHQFHPDYWEILQRAITGGHDPAEVVLMEIDPLEQKTLPDFLLTEKFFGVRTVSMLEVEQRGRRLYHAGVPIRRIYNRVIFDELDRKGIRPPFDMRGDLDVEWAGHPNWYFKLSKFSIPFLRHEAAPKTWFLDRLTELPPDLDNYVLKPLYSFAGLGVAVGPTLDEVRSVDPAKYILQERIRFRPVIDTPHGMTQAEVRIMYVWLDGEPEPRAMTTIVRTGRGRMMGVDHNRDLEWVGATAGLFPV